MAITVHDIRNGIRGGVGRFKREVTAAFTKEELAAIVEALGQEPVETTAGMRRQIREATEMSAQGEQGGQQFSREELEVIASALDVVPVEDDEPNPLY